MAIEKRYTLQDFTPDVAVGIKLPFVSKSGKLFDQSYSTEQQAISNLKNLLLTARGERPFQPRFGTNIRKLLFNPNTDDLKEQIGFEITDAINFWLPYITIDSLKINSVISESGVGIEENGVTISLRISINGQRSETPITFLFTQSTALEI